MDTGDIPLATKVISSDNIYQCLLTLAHLEDKGAQREPTAGKN